MMTLTYPPAEIPSNIYKPKAPFKARILHNDRITHTSSPNEVHHVVIDIKGSELRYLAGQSLGILPHGSETGESEHKLRLYSIASPGRGDDGEGNTVSLCVKRLVYRGEEGEETRGVCSNYLCDLQPGSAVFVTGPVGKTFLLPSEANANLIMVGTGTGIAPFRGFLHERYNERKAETGQAHLFFGAQTRQDYLYEKEMNMFNMFETFYLHTAFSREQQNPDGGRMYVQHRLYEQRDIILKLLMQGNTTFYVCGLRGMETGILEVMQQAALDLNVDWDALLATLKREHRWHIEVY
jgi:ferredoxin--NADP+ reductase